jgi:signal peptidase II
MRGKFIFITLLVLVLDNLTKYIVSTAIGLYSSVEIIQGYVRLTYVRNFGVAFGYFKDPGAAWKPYLLAGLAAVAVVVIIIYSRRVPLERVLLQAALAVTMGGILGNFTDRIMRGWVVDFIDLHIKDTFSWPTFNVADSAITIGIAMLLIDALKHRDPDVCHKEGISPEQ